MALIAPTALLQSVQSPSSTIEWHRELDQLSFSWRERQELPEITPADAEATMLMTKSRQDTIQSFAELLSTSESREAGYASIYARIASSLPKDSIVRDALNDALTVAVAALFLHDEAQDTVDNFNTKVITACIEPIQDSGQRLVEALERCNDLSLADFDTCVVKPMIGFFAEVQKNVESITKTAHRDSLAFLQKTASIVEQTGAFVVTTISHAALSMIGDAINATSKRVSAHLTAAAHEHQDFLRETAQMMEELVFQGDEAFKVA